MSTEDLPNLSYPALTDPWFNPAFPDMSQKLLNINEN